MLVKLFASV